MNATRPADEQYQARGHEISAVSGFDRLRNGSIMPVAAFFAMLMIVVGLVLFIACTNVASLMEDLNRDGLFDAKDWQYYRLRRTSSNSAMAVKLGGREDITETHVLWRYDKSLPDVPGILLYKDVLYLICNGGILQTLDPAIGKLLNQGRLAHALDEYYASPVAGDGKVYMISRHGNVSVLEAGAEWNVAATGELGEEVFATPAIADGHIWVRTASALYDFASQ